MAKNKTFKTLVTAVKDLSMTRDLETVMRIVRTVARELADADGATFVLRDHDLCYYADEDAISPLWKGQRFPMSACVSGWAMLHRKSVVIEDIYSDPRIPIDVYRKTFVKSLVMVPIRTIDPLGAIGVYWAQPHKPSRDEVSLIQSLADITAVTLENVRVYQELEQRIKTRTFELMESLEREREVSETKSRFLSMASHELRTPLSTILSSLTLIEKYGHSDDAEKKAKHIDRIRGSVKTLLSTLGDFLEADKLDQGKAVAHKERFDIEQFVKSTLELMEGNLKHEQSIHYKHEGQPVVYQDRSILANLLLNLVSNASKYSLEHKPIFVETVVDAEKVVLRVIDHGIGIHEADLERLFDRFYRGRNVGSTQGTGLGLNIVRRYVDLLNGDIVLNSELHHGTTVTVQFKGN